MIRLHHRPPEPVEQVDEIARRIVDHVPTYPISHVCQLEDTDPEPLAELRAPYERAALERAAFLATGLVTTIAEDDA